MKILTILFLTAISLQGCTVYNIYSVASAGTAIGTGKSLTDHATSAATQGDCNILHVFTGKFYCELNDPGTTFNRNGI